MKKFFTLLVLAACCAAMTWGCSDDKYDDTEIRQEIENLKQEIASMNIIGEFKCTVFPIQMYKKV